MSVPSLPPAAAVPPANTAAAALSTAGTKLIEAPVSADPPRLKKVGRTKRALSRVVMLGLLGGGGWTAYQHGPGLYDEYVAESDAPDEPDAPLGFPTPSLGATPVRVAVFTLTDVTGAPGTDYTVKTDFETDVTQVIVHRDGAPSVEVLTYAEAAFIHRLDDPQWYQLERGGFPLDDRLERSDWVRTLDELISPTERATTPIRSATESVVAAIPTRRLVVSVDPATLGTVRVPQIGVSARAAVPDPAREPTEVEIWVDGSGLVRQISGAPQLGAETITVVETSSEAWVPEFPVLDGVLPLTASALVELGL